MKNPDLCFSPCEGCPFAGDVTEVSVNQRADGEVSIGTVKTTFNRGSDDITVTLVQPGGDGTATETVKSGDVDIAVFGQYADRSFSVADAERKVMRSMLQCSTEGPGPLEGPKHRIAGIGLGAMKACGAFYAQSKPGAVPRRKSGIAGVRPPKTN